MHSYRVASLSFKRRGDILALINLLETIVSGLQDHGGAADELRQIIQELEQHLTVFQYVASLKVLDTYSSQQRAIIGIAESLHQTSTRLHKKIAKYILELGRGAPAGFHRGVVTKARWVLFVSKEVPKYRSSISAQCASLRCLSSKLIIDIASQSAAQGRETHALVENAITVQNSHQMWAENLLAETQASLTTIKGQNEALSDFAADRVRAMNSSQRRMKDSTSSAHDTLKKSNRQREAILYKTTESITTNYNNFQDLKSTVKDSTLAAEHLSKRNHAMISPHPQQIANQISSFSVNGRVNTSHCHDSRDVREIAIDLHSFTDIQLFALYTLIRQGLGFIRNLLHVYPQLILFLGVFQAVPASMSTLLSDNITVLDVLDRKHSLPFEYFQDLGVFKAMLLSKFKEAPGFEKIRDGEFSIVDSSLGDKALNLDERSQIVRPRARLVMTIHYSTLKLSKRQCVKCRGSMLEVKPYYWECPACNISFRVPYLKSGPEADIRSFDVATPKFQHLLGYDLGVYNDLEEFRNYQRLLLDYRGRLFGSKLEDETLGKEPDLQASPSNLGFRAMHKITKEVEAGDLWEEISSEDTLSHMTHVLNTELPLEASERQPALSGSSGEPHQGARTLEENQLQYFKRVRIEEESLIYRAALAGDYQAVRDILGSSPENHETYAPWGSALTAAVI